MPEIKEYIMSNLKKLLSILTACLVLMSCTFLIGCGDKENSNNDDDDKSTSDKKDKDDKDDESSSKKDDKSSSEKDDKSSSDKEDESETTTTKKKATTTEKKKPSVSSGFDYDIDSSVSSDFDEDALDPVNVFFNIFNTLDASQILDIFPDAMIDIMAFSMGVEDISDEELIAMMFDEENPFEDVPEDFSINFYYDVLDADKFSNSDIDAANEWLAFLNFESVTAAQLEALGLPSSFNVDSLSATEGYTITIDLTVDAAMDGDEVSASHEFSFDVVKIDGTWTFDLFSGNGTDFMTAFTEAFEEDFEGEFETVFN
jgi:hypothetical protein